MFNHPARNSRWPPRYAAMPTHAGYPAAVLTMHTFRLESDERIPVGFSRRCVVARALAQGAVAAKIATVQQP